MKINDAIEASLNNTKIKNVDELLLNVRKLTNTKLKDNPLHGRINKYLSEEMSFNFLIDFEENIARRSELFKKTRFKIKLQPEEFLDERLYIGHRFIPFIKSDYKDKDIVLKFNGKKIELLEAVLPLEQGMKYILNLPPYVEEVYDIDSEKNTIRINYFDIANFIEAEKLDEKDYLEISVKNFEKLEYELRKFPFKKYLSEKIISKNKKDALGEIIHENIEEYPFEPLDYAFFRAFAEVKKSKILENPGFTIPEICAENSDRFKVTNNYGHAVFEDVEGNLFENEINKMLNDEVNMPEPGKSKDLNGIFAELGSSYTVEILTGMIILDFKTKGKVDDQQIISTVIKAENGFFNKKQEKNFYHAYIKLREKTIKNWENRKLTLKQTNFLRDLIKFKISFVDFLREIDSKIQDDPQSFDPSSMQFFTPMDMVTEIALNAFLKDPEETKSPEFSKIEKELKKIYKDFETESKAFLRTL